MQEPKLRIDGLRKAYGNVHALRETFIEVPAGEFLTLLGPSGSGKTTLLMIIAGLVMPDGGEFWIDGKCSTYTAPFQRHIGMVFQNYALFPHLSVSENIAFPLRMRRVPEKEIAARVSRILEIVKLPHVAQRLPRELSGGQQQRIAFARSAVYEPSVILMDEPLGALDKKLRDQMQIEIKRLHKELGVTILYVTHDQEEAMAMSDRICLMNEGRVEQIGAPEDLYFRPQSIFAAQFLGDSNIFPVSDPKRDAQYLVARHASGAPIRALAASAQTADLNGMHIMVRPEHVTVVRGNASTENCLPAKLEQSVVIGAVTRHYARLADGTPFTALQITEAPERRLPAGSDVFLTWQPESSVVLPSGKDIP